MADLPQDSTLSADARPWLASADWPYAYGPPPAKAKLRVEAEDFQVDEVLSFDPIGEGDHVYLQMRKRDTNTRWLAERLAGLAKIQVALIGYAGLKDRRAVATQWFSIPVPPSREPDWRQLEGPDLQILAVSRHPTKLQRRDTLLCNRFVIRLRDVLGEGSEIEGRLELVATHGVPNYFGAQRFGQDLGNLERADALLRRKLGRIDPFHRGLYISAARSHLFNQVLARRVQESTWNQALAGERLIDSAGQLQISDEACGQGPDRLAKLEWHPTGPLWGRGRPLVGHEVGNLEAEVLAPYSAWCYGLEHVGLAQERRALRLCPRDLRWEWEQSDTLVLAFALPAGSYATMVVREVADTEDKLSDGDQGVRVFGLGGRSNT